MVYRFKLSLFGLSSPLICRFGSRIVPFSSSSSSVSSGQSNLAILRKKTGLAFTLCKKALELHNNDIEAASAYLKEESIKHGYAKAAKLKSRQTTQGLVGLVLDDDAKRCALLEVNCETDFVARNTNFRQLIAQLTLDLFSPSNQSKPSSTITNEFTTKSIFSSEDLNFFTDSISSAVTKLGENIKLSRALIYHLNQPARNDLLLFGHTHASGDYIADIDGVKLGKYGAIVLLRQLPNEERKQKSIDAVSLEETKQSSADTKKEEKLSEEKQLTDEEIDNQELDIEFVEEKIEYTVDNVGKILCQQIIGMSPVYLQKTPKQLAKDKELTEKGFKISDNDEYLMEQKTIVEPNLSVADFCEEHGLQILDFIRYECGVSTDET